MHNRNQDTDSVMRFVIEGGSRLAAYALRCKKRGMTYRAFVEELEVWRRDVMKTPDGVLMHPECNERIDMVLVTAAWRALKTSQLEHLYLKN